MLYDRARLGSDACEMQRKIIHDDRKRKQSEFVTDASNSQSIVSTMERFVKAVNDMNEHIILPTKLLDPEEDEESQGAAANADVPVMLRGRGNNTTTRYDFYHCLNTIKKDLVLGVSANDDDEEDSDDIPYNSHTERPNTSYNKVLSTNSLHQQTTQKPTRRHSTICVANQRSQSTENLPTRKISLNILPTENNLHSITRQDNNGSTVNLVQRQDSWASLNPLPEEQQPSRKTGWTAVNSIPEYHRQVTCDSGTECDEADPGTMGPAEIAEQLREHLQGLQIGFSHLTNTAKYITKSIE